MNVNADGLLAPNFRELETTAVVEGIVEDFRVLRRRDDPRLSRQARDEQGAKAGHYHARWRVRVERWVRGAGPTLIYVQEASFDNIESNEGHNPFLVGNRYRFYLEELPQLGSDFRRLMDGEPI